MSTTVTLNTFNGGMTNDDRDTSASVATLLKHFDIRTRPHRLSPYRSSVNAYSAQDTARMVNFLYANGHLYGLGVAGFAALMFTSTVDVPSWATPINNADSTGTPSQILFVQYHNYIYGAADGTRLWRHGDITGTPTFTSTWQSLAYTNIAQGLVHSQDDVLYIPYDNKIASLNGSTFNATALTLPSSYIISSICEFGSYLAIGCKPASGFGNSRVFLWDRDVSLSTVSESIDWGVGSLQVLEEIQGALIGISIAGSNTAVFAPKVVFKEYSSTQGAVTFREISASGSSSFIYSKQKTNDGVLFLMDITIAGTRHPGIWAVSRIPGGGYAVSFDRLPDDDTPLDSGTGLLEGFFKIGDYVYISYQTGGVFYLRKTDDQANYNSTSIYETTQNPSMPANDRSKNKRLQAVSLSYVPLPSGASATLKYQVDGGGWIPVFTEATDGATNTEMTVDGSGVAFTDGHNYQFHAESTGGAEITEVKYRYEPLETNL